jgi:hypothetical protein
VTVRNRGDDGPPLLGATAHYRDGRLIGPVGGAYVDELHGRPEWVAVWTERLVPAARTTLAPDGRLVVALPDLSVELSPPLAAGAPDLHLGDEDRLHGYYAAVLHPALSVVPDPAPGPRGGPRLSRVDRPTHPDGAGPAGRAVRRARR